MRITGGELRGRILKVPRVAGLRPTQDLVRGSLFSMLGERLPGAAFLDLYAGTGAVGIEAWSRGAGWICWVESAVPMLRALEENVRALGVDRCRIVRGDAMRALQGGLPGAPFDVIFADPPYARPPAREASAEAHAPRRERSRDRRPDRVGSDWGHVLQLVEEGALLKDGAWFVMEQGADEPAVERPGWLLVRDRRYGGTRLRVLERTGPTAETGT